jgi:transposase
MKTQFTVITERIDDVVLLLHVMKQMELPELLNQHLPRHWKQEGLDWVWVAVIWLAYIPQKEATAKLWYENGLTSNKT